MMITAVTVVATAVTAGAVVVTAGMVVATAATAAGVARCKVARSTMAATDVVVATGKQKLNI